MSMSMFSKLESVELRFVELESSLARADLSGKELTKLIKERGAIAELIETYRSYKNAIADKECAQEMLRDNDPETRAMAKDELESLGVTINDLEDALRILTLPQDPNDDKNVIVEIRAGTGGDEAAIFVGDLLRMYQRCAEKQGWQCEMLSSTPSNVGGLKEVMFLLKGDKIYSRLKFESGVHRVQRVPVTETQGRVHTSACTVAILAEADELEEIVLNPKDLDISTTRSSGAGGQHVNTTDSAIRIVHVPSGIAVECQAERSQHKNKEKALKVLKARLKEKAEREQASAMAQDRKGQVGTGDRSERIRTYNFPQGRLTDHRINLTLYKLDQVMEGDIGDVLDALASHYQTELLKQEMAQV